MTHIQLDTAIAPEIVFNRLQRIDFTIYGGLTIEQAEVQCKL